MALAYKEHAAVPASRRALVDLSALPEIDETQGRLTRSRRLLMLASLFLADVVAAQIAFWLGAELYAGVVSPGTAAFGFGPELAVIALTLPVGYVLLDVYGAHGQAPIERFPLRIKTTCVLFALLVAWHYASRRIVWPGGAAALTFAFMVVLPLIGESIVR